MFIVNVILNVFVQFLSNPTILIALIVLIGLLMQKKSAADCIKGTIKTIVGFTLISSGAGIVQTAIGPLNTMMQGALNMTGTLPVNESCFAVASAQFGAALSGIMVIALIINIVVEDVVRTSEINYYPFNRQIDFVVSTVSFECRYPVVRVRPILTDEDKANIATLMMLLDINSSSDSMQLKILLGIVRQNVDDETYVRIRKDLNRYLNTGGVLVNVPTAHQISLYDILKKYGVRYVEEASSDWENAVRMTAAPLLEQQCIENRYVEKMLAADDIGKMMEILSQFQ